MDITVYDVTIQLKIKCSYSYRHMRDDDDKMIMKRDSVDLRSVVCYMSSSLLESSINFPMSGRGGGRMREGRGMEGRESSRASGVRKGSRCSDFEEGCWAVFLRLAPLITGCSPSLSPLLQELVELRLGRVGREVEEAEGVGLATAVCEGEAEVPCISVLHIIKHADKHTFVEIFVFLTF